MSSKSMNQSTSRTLRSHVVKVSETKLLRFPRGSGLSQQPFWFPFSTMRITFSFTFITHTQRMSCLVSCISSQTINMLLDLQASFGLAILFNFFEQKKQGQWTKSNKTRTLEIPFKWISFLTINLSTISSPLKLTFFEQLPSGHRGL